MVVHTKMHKITIINYGLGNINAFVNVYKRLDISITIANLKSELMSASHLILPGVGSFDYAMKMLNQSGLRETIEKLVLEDKKPIIGICVGMQMLATSSDEGTEKGLGWIEGRVRNFKDNSLSTKLATPHMGWNDVVSVNKHQLFDGIDNTPRFYFLHSFYFECLNPDNIITKTNYGFEFVSAVRKDNIYGVQFHPEKSHNWGSCLLSNFAKL